MRVFPKILTGAAGLAMIAGAATPAVAQYNQYGNQYGNNGGVVGAVINSVLGGGRYGAYGQGNDRIAVMAALSVAAEFLSVKSPQGPLSDMTMLEVKQKLEVMHSVLDQALAPQENLS